MTAARSSGVRWAVMNPSTAPGATAFAVMPYGP